MKMIEPAMHRCNHKELGATVGEFGYCAVLYGALTLYRYASQSQ